jgi:dTDP-4-amino-4,6-dideoxygalactose transaminase
MINVTKTFFPPFNEYSNQLKRIWKNEWLTNRGELVLELESKLKSLLEVPHLIIMSNGTIPLQIALKIIGNRGEIITTPFSYVATSSAIIWENCFPIFVDIHPEYLTIDENKIEEAITPKTTAILATHVFGNPCNIEKINEIARRYNLKVIYDAAHSFGVTYKNKSVFEYGDVSTCSFHATKIFHTGEGGAIFCNDSELFHKLFYSHNFGHNGPTDFHGLGINGKISELQAAMGLSVLPHIEYIFNERKRAVEYYTKNLNFKILRTFKLRQGTGWNYSYFPVIFSSELELLEVQLALNNEKIFPRRYFYPSLNKIEFLNGTSMPVSESIASRILCLPLYCDMPISLLDKICLIVNSSILTKI